MVYDLSCIFRREEKIKNEVCLVTATENDKLFLISLKELKVTAALFCLTENTKRLKCHPIFLSIMMY
jgi:hypothetical protein